ncbi:hypothetical protein PUNSTDRAFT_131772 [Punctularia strigosozonata HHB-11173 SS5]|uniref:uncharacterized protein n=1 Tax=Punctularia strigosozonata (strain HHB-11173) TaxID=741275 RepID=UPI0004418285|nr:uncharacterized protein PUNSTDRAFT_131772 [Punctularia strigosozonata HHB-11173 SS5]EIN11615.1 hypothetical protein PUNSTDRAFT_131772 [Punctularia strigosozonata HHB-11173 SS5]
MTQESEPAEERDTKDARVQQPRRRVLWKRMKSSAYVSVISTKQLCPPRSGSGSVANDVFRCISPLCALPDDLVLHLFTFLAVDDILSLRRTSKRFGAVTRTRWVWQDALARHVLARRLPIPAPEHFDPRTASARALELRAVRAARLDRNWRSGSPKPTRSSSLPLSLFTLCSILCTGVDVGDSVSQICFLPGSGGERLVAVFRQSMLVCLDVPLCGADPRAVAMWFPPSGSSLEIVANEDPASAGQLAVVYIGPVDETLVVLSLDEFHGEFIVEATLNGHLDVLAPLCSLRGAHVLAGSSLTLWNWRTGARTALTAVEQYPLVDGVPTRNRVCAARLLGSRGGPRYVLAVQERSIALVPLVADPNEADEVLRTVPDDPGYEIPLASACAEATVLPNPDSGSPSATIVLRLADGAGVRVARLVFDPERSGSPCAIVLDILPLALPPSAGGFAFGPSGRGVCLVTRNLAAPSGRERYPARCVVPLDVGVGGAGEDASEAWAGEGHVYARRCGVGEVAARRYQLTAVALEDAVGRVAIGDRDGIVRVLDFA